MEYQLDLLDHELLLASNAMSFLTAFAGSSTKNTSRVLCSYCHSENVNILAPSKLAEYFELLISAYEPNAGGALLVNWFRDDWSLFEHPRMDDPRVQDLLGQAWACPTSRSELWPR